MSIIDKIRKEIAKEQRKPNIRRTYIQKGRYIPHRLHVQLKRQRICQLCNKRFDILEIHHIKPISQGGTNTKDNLICLCHDCHKIVDRVSGAH